MKLLIVFNSLPEIMFLWYDEDYLKHLKKSLSRDEFWGTFDVDKEDVRLDVIGQRFSPLIASQKYMLDIGNPYSSITCEDGSILVIRQFDDLFYISLCGDGEESEWFLQRRLCFFHYLVNATFGPSTDHLKPVLTLKRQEKWQYLKGILDTWHTLCRQEQMFLVESIEILSVNAELSSRCLHLLEEVLSKANKENTAVHSLLFVNNKLLGLYSKASLQELKPSDILLLIVFVKEKFKYLDQLVPYSLNRTPPQLASRKPSKSTVFAQKESTSPKEINQATAACKSVGSPSSVTDFMSANSTPGIDPSCHSEKYHTPHGSPTSISSNERDGSKQRYYLAEQGNDPDASADNKSETSPTSSEISAGAASRNPSLKETSANSNLTVEEETQKHHRIQLFLKTQDCPFTPCDIDMIKLDSATVLVTISEHKMAKYAVLIYEILRFLRILLKKHGLTIFSDKNFTGKLFEKLDGCIKVLVESISKNSDLHYDILLNNISILKERWESAKQNGLRGYMDSEEAEMPSQLYTPLMEVVKGVRAVFAFLFIQLKQELSERHMKVMSSIHDLAISRFSDFSSYLQVRGQRNVTMTAYYNDFPGLVHFIYINRSTNHLIAPSINHQTESTGNVQHVIKQHVWEMWQYAESHVSKGYSSFIIKDGEFIFSYFIWFEDTMGKSLSVQRNPKPNYRRNFTGVMSSDFYSDLIKHCFPTLNASSVHCYELFCIHIGIVNNKFVTASCKKLAALLWETSGEASSPIGLL